MVGREGIEPSSIAYQAIVLTIELHPNKLEVRLGL